MTAYKLWQKRVWEIVEAAGDGDLPSKTFDVFILALIVLNIFAVIFGSVNWIDAKYKSELDLFELVSVIVFSIEYFLRVWSCPASDEYRAPIKGRIKFLFSFMALIDLSSILPFFLPFLGFDMRALRVLRLVRILRVAKLGRYYSSLELIKRVVFKKKEELILTSALMIFLLIISSSIIYSVEAELQPEAFSSIPATMWWSVATLTTVGYGDITPKTPLGQFLASLIAILGVGMFALPTGILGAGFVEEIGQTKKSCTCPHCGKEIS